MKFKKLTQNAILPKKHEDQTGIQLFANESVRIPPNQTAVIHTGITVEDMGDEILLLSLERKMGHMRPFIMSSGLEVISKSLEGSEITIILFNRSKNIPAVVDEGEAIAYGLNLNLSSLSSIKPTNNRKKVDKID